MGAASPLPCFKVLPCKIDLGDRLREPMLFFQHPDIQHAQVHLAIAPRRRHIHSTMGTDMKVSDPEPQLIRPSRVSALFHFQEAISIRDHCGAVPLAKVALTSPSFETLGD